MAEPTSEEENDSSGGSDGGTPSYDSKNAAVLSALGIPAFGCTADQFPDLMAAAIERQDIASWAARQDIVTVRGSG